MSSSEPPSIVIIGAGVAGLCLAMQLQRSGRDDYLIVEKGSGVGGTWRDNTYPGCACDVPSLFYSFSFETKRDWSRLFPGQPEILGYLESCAKKYDLTRNIRFGSEVTSAQFNDATDHWTVTLDSGEEIVSQILISSVGQLNRPAYPDVPGIEDFSGQQFHSARWNHDVDLSGKRVAVIGNGCSAVQFIPEIVPKLKQLTLFQRSAHWLIPRGDAPFSDKALSRFERFPVLVRLYRYLIWLRYELMLYPLMKRSSWLRARIEKVSMDMLEEQVADPELRAKLTPDYPMGCKRVIIHDSYYPALTRDNVDVDTTAVVSATANGLELADGRHLDVDVVIYGTGFAASGFLAPMEIKGRDGLDLNEVWRDGAQAYLGMTVPGFPNFFMTYGPNTNLGHNSIIFMIENQSRYILKCLARMSKQGTTRIEVQAQAADDFNQSLQQDIADKTVWVSSCDSWYKNAAGKVVNNWSGSTFDYWLKTRSPEWAYYDEC
ncbi:MAG: NAD(P)/FAD-dependent oxidoreductase [Pseudomonadaceae bacterium]|nr:NAD(P)/FAD-dependent oxidoreductase [Pseudomonadaceae bacterium]